MANALRTEYELLDQAESHTLWPVRLVAAIVFLNGFFAILEVLYIRFSTRLEGLLPVDYEYYGRFFGLFAGFLLIYFSGRLLARKRLAWWIAFVGSVLIVVDHGLFSRQLSALLLPGLSLVLLAFYHDEFDVLSEPASIRQGVGLLALSVLIALTYGTIGFAKLLPRDFTPPHKVTLTEGVDRTVREFTLVGNDDLVPRTAAAKWFLASLDIFGAASIVFAFLSLFRPLAYQFRILPHERQRAAELLDEYGTSSEDAFKLWPEDKSYFFGGKSFLAYRVERGVALVLGDPVGPTEQQENMIRQFRTYCHLHDWGVAFMYVAEASLRVYEEVGLKPLKIGQDAIIETDKFVSDASNNKHFRAVRNKFERLGYRFEVSMPPHSAIVQGEVANVTRSWLKTGGRVERGFAMGYHDVGYISRNTLYLLYGDDGVLAAFANSIRSYDPVQETIDLMRYRSDAETGTMDYLIFRIIEQLHERKVAEFSLGLAPLTGVGVGPERTTEERVVHYIRSLGLGGFSYEGVERFKSKFEPRWEDRYIVYERGPVGLARTAVSLGEVMRRL
jgi:phosphatidylglycerol lysyltransferase